MEDFLNASELTEEDSGDEQLTAAQVLEKLQEAWMNERLSPNLMECKSDIVECILQQMQEMEDNINRATKRDFKVTLHQLELDRIRYVMSSYLRCRLEKIEMHAPVLLEREKTKLPTEPSRLSPEEFAFAKEVASNLEAHLKLVVAKHMPTNLQNMNLQDIVQAPDLDHYVFLKVNHNEDGVIIDAETEDHGADKVDLEKGAQHLMRYKPVEALIENGTVSLM